MQSLEINIIIIYAHTRIRQFVQLSIHCGRTENDSQKETVSHGLTYGLRQDWRPESESVRKESQPHTRIVLPVLLRKEG